MKKLVIIWLSMLAVAIPAHGMKKSISRMQKHLKKHPKKYTSLAIASGIGGFVAYKTLPKNRPLLPQEIVERGIVLASRTDKPQNLNKYISIMVPYVEIQQDNEHEELFATITSYKMSDIPEELLKEIADNKELQRKLFKFYYINKNSSQPTKLSLAQKKLWQKIFSQHTLEELYEATYYEAKTEHLVRTIAPEFADTFVKANHLWQAIHAKKMNMPIPENEKISHYHTLAQQHGVTIQHWVTVEFKNELIGLGDTEICANNDGITIYVSDNQCKQTDLLAGILAHEYGHIALGHSPLLSTAINTLFEGDSETMLTEYNKRFKSLNHHIELSADIFSCLMSPYACTAHIKSFEKVYKRLRLELINAIVQQQKISRKKAIELVDRHPSYKNILDQVGEIDTHPSYATRINNMKKVLKQKEMIETHGCTLNPFSEQLNMQTWFNCRKPVTIKKHF